jgi:radical SAM protein with 4Fe4S-binding SPASM domain
MTGFFARVEDDGYREPLWSQHGPELLDISITKWCDRECKICYRSANKHGQHMRLSDYELIMRQAVAMNVSQVALGGGNPNQHPDFVKILEVTRQGYGIVPSYTTNGRGLNKEILKTSGKYCGAVAVSAYPPFQKLKPSIRLLIDAGIRTNVHFVLSSESIDTAIEWLREPPDLLSGVNALIFLSYKSVGRAKGSLLYLQIGPMLHDFFALVSNEWHGFRIGFDSCLVPGLVSYTTVNPAFFEACEAARFSMFISEKMLMYPCSFMESQFEGIRIEEGNMLNAWRNGRSFQSTRKKLFGDRCLNCRHAHVCLGGCPVFNELQVCDKTQLAQTQH